MTERIAGHGNNPSAGDRVSGEDAAASASAFARSPSPSSSRLNARAPEFLPRPPSNPSSPIHHAAAAAAASTTPVMNVFTTPPPSPPPYYAPGKEPYYGAGAAGGSGLVEPDAANAAGDRDSSTPSAREGLSDEVIQKTTRQVEYYFSDLNLATTEHLMRFITKDPEGFVPISVVAAFRKIKGLINNNSQLAVALRTSSKLVVSDDGKRVRRQEPFTESDMEEMQARIVVAENLPEDHSYQNLMKIFSAVGSVNTIRTCYPQTPNGTATPANKSTKLDMLFGNRLHAFVEYETAEDAENAVAELNDEQNWRSGLRLRLLSKCLTKHGSSRGKRGNETEMVGEEDVSTSTQSNEKQAEDWLPSSEASNENLGDDTFTDKDGALKQGRGRGRGGRGRGRGQHHNNNRGGSHRVGTPPSSHMMHSEQPAAANKQPPGPRMPNGTRGFTMGRGKPVVPISTD